MSKYIKVKYAILGAGPSGLAVAHALLRGGLNPSEIVVLEKEGVAGGLCRSEVVDGSPLDIGGGHFLDTKRTKVLDFLFQFMPKSEWQIFDRIAKIRIHNVEIDHPLEANLWQLSTNLQLDYLESIASSGCNKDLSRPAPFDEWIKWKFGSLLSSNYLLPYNRKIWSMDLNTLGTYWLYKLPNVSFRDTLLSCLEGRPAGTLPAHGQFFYPKKYGYGEVWRRMGEALGKSLWLNCAIEDIDLSNLIINKKWRAEKIINTIPWPLWPTFCKIPSNINRVISQLKNASINVDYIPTTLKSKSHWIYEPNEDLPYHRLLLRSNFIKNSKGHWTETNSLRSPPFFSNGTRYFNEFAYPINTVNKPENMHQLLTWAASHHIIGLGRWGKWEHMNSDVAVEEAIELAVNLNKK